jgi:hypothetical protein
MRQAAASMTPESVQFRTTAKRKGLDEYLALADRITQDADRDVRVHQCLCLSCFYFKNRTISGQAFTYRPCGLCDLELISGSTNSDTLCIACAQKHKLCSHCGADFDLRTKRRKFDWFKKRKK